MNKTLATTCAFVFSVSFAYADILHIQNGNNVPISVGYGTDAGSIPVQVLGTVTTTGGGGGSSVNVSTYVYGTALGSTGTAIGGVTPAGNFQTFSVDTSSRISVNSYSQNITTITHNGIAQPVSISSSAGSITIVPFSSGTYTVTPGTGTFIITHNGIPQPIVPSTGTYVVTQGSGNATVPWTVGNSTIAVIQSTSAAIGSTIAVVNAIGTGLSVNPGTGTLNVQGVLGNAAANTATRIATLPGIATTQYANPSGGAAYNPQNLIGLPILANSALVGTWSGPDDTFLSYSASTTPFTIANSTQDITALCGRSGASVFVYYLKVDCTQTTAANIPITIAKRSSKYTGSWSTMTSVTEDSVLYSVATSSAIYFQSQNLTNGTLVGYVDSGQIFCTATSTPTANQAYTSPDNWRMKSIMLRGVNECLGVNIQNASVPGAKFTADWRWMEITTP